MVYSTKQLVGQRTAGAYLSRDYDFLFTTQWVVLLRSDQDIVGFLQRTVQHVESLQIQKYSGAVEFAYATLVPIAELIAYVRTNSIIVISGQIPKRPGKAR